MQAAHLALWSPGGRAARAAEMGSVPDCVKGSRTELATSALRTRPAASRNALQEQGLANGRAVEDLLQKPAINRRVA